VQRSVAEPGIFVHGAEMNCLNKGGVDPAILMSIIYCLYIRIGIDYFFIYFIFDNICNL
jgi:hypothetical protein